MDLNSLTDLENLASPTLLKLGSEFVAYLNQPLSSLPAALSGTSVQYTGGSPTWTPGPITFTLSGGVSGKVSVITTGDLLTYTGGFPTQVVLGAAPAANPNSSATIPAAPNTAYVVLELDFQISGGLSGSYTSGIYGVSTATTAAASITVAFYKACDPATTLQAAVAQAFESFVLPLHPNTLNNLKVGDYLFYNFNASLQLGLGASVGLDKVFYAGQFTSQIPSTAGAVCISAGIQPEIQAGAQLAFSYDYTGTFEILLWREASNKAHLHLYRSKIQDTSLGLNLGITLTAGASASLAVTTTQLQNTLTQALPSALQAPFTSNVLTPGQQEVDKYVGDLNSRVSSWLSPVNNQKCSLDLAIEHTSDRFLLTNYTIDLTQPYQSAWNDMVAGKFLDAMRTQGSGVSLDVGSGLENIYNTTSSVKLNLFGALSATWTSSIVSNSSLIYAGNNTFHLITNEGRDVLTLINGSKREISIYFSAEVDVSQTNAALPAINLNVMLQAANNSGFGAYIGNIVGLLASGQMGAALASSVKTLASRASSTETLHLVISPAAYAQLQASTIAHGKPDNENLDIPNYNAFAQACGQLFTEQPANFQWNGNPLTYDIWRNSNIASNDEWPAPAGALPDRTSSAGYNSSAQSQLQGVFPGIGIAGNGVYFCFVSAGRFMNFCADLKSLHAGGSINLGNWNDLVTQLEKIMRKDVTPYFIAPTALALANLCGGVPRAISGPAPNLPSGNAIAVTVTY
jgi:hypothetical protein